MAPQGEGLLEAAEDMVPAAACPAPHRKLPSQQLCPISLTCARVGAGGGRLRICDAVHVYGFVDQNKHSDPQPAAPYHYYDDAVPETATHSFDLTRHVFERLQRAAANLFFH